MAAAKLPAWDWSSGRSLGSAGPYASSSVISACGSGSAGEIEVRSEDAHKNEAGGGHFLPAPAGVGPRLVLRCRRAKGEVLDLFGVRHGRRETDDDHDDRRHQGDKDAEVLEIDVVDDPKEGTWLISVGKAPEFHRDRRIHQHPENAEGKTHDHGRQAPQLGEPGP